MNALGMVIAANLGATFVIFCGLKLFDLGSELAEPIRRYGVFLGIIIAFVTIFNFLIPDALEVLDGDYILFTSIVGAVAFSFIGFLLSIARRCLLIPKRAKSRKAGRMSKLSISAIGVIDVIEGVIAGAAAGVSFSINTGTGVMMLCAMILLLIIDKVNCIRKYQEALFTRRENITMLSLSLLAMPAASILVSVWARERYAHIGIFMALAVAYLVYLCIYHLVLVVKKYQKR